MAIFSGRYSWDGTKKNNVDPIAWSPGAYDINIFQHGSTASDKVEHMKSHVCVFARTGEGHSVSAKPEKFAKQICTDFSLDLERVLWIEDHLSENDRYEVVMFTRSAKVGGIIFYKTEKRKALDREIKLVQQQMTKEKNL